MKEFSEMVGAVMVRQTNKTWISATAGIFVAILTLGVAMSGGTMARADDPPKKSGDGKIKFIVLPVTKTLDKNAKPPKQTPNKQPQPGNGKPQPPRGN